VSGCAPRQPFYFFEDGDLSHYVGAVQKIEYPDTCQDPLDEAAGSIEPLTLSNANFDEIWELPLKMQFVLHSKMAKYFEILVADLVALEVHGPRLENHQSHF
jgi:hypothetical protein